LAVHRGFDVTAAAQGRVCPKAGDDKANQNHRGTQKNEEIHTRHHVLRKQAEVSR
jgi:hypothetical protein